MEKSQKTPIKNYKIDPEWKHFFGSITRGFVLEEIFLNKAGEPVDYCILAMNKTGEKMWGLSAADSIGKTGHQIRSKSQRFLLHTLASVIKTGKSTRFEFFSERMDRFFDLEVFNPAKGIVAILISDITDERNTKNALRESEDKFKYIFDYSVVGKSITLPSGEIHINKAFSKMLGYTQEELQNKRWQEITHPDDIELTQKEMDAFLTGKKKAARFTKRFLRKDGIVIWADIASSLRRDKEGKPLYFMTTIVDITEQKSAEEEKYKLSQRYSTLLSSVPEIIMEVNNKKVYTWANPAGYEFFGDDVVGKTAAHYFEGKQDTYDSVTPLFTGDENTFYVESWQRRKDGQKRLLAWWCRALKDEKGNVLGALSSAQDITERKQAEEVLRKSEERYHSLFENMLNGFAYCQMLYDGKRPVDFIYLDVNRAFETLTGLKNAAGKKVSELIPGIRESDPELFKIYSRVALTGKPVVFETYVEALKMWFSVSVYSPQIKYFVAVFDVITKRKTAEVALQKSNTLLDSIIKQSPNAMWISDERGTLLRINPACCELLNITEEEVVGKYNVFNDNIVQEQGLMPLIKSVFDKGKPVKFEITYDTSQLKHLQLKGKKFVVLDTTVFPITDENRKITNVVILHNDITERKQVEQALRASEEKFRSLFESMSEITVLHEIVYDKNRKAIDYKIIDCNAAFARITGIAYEKAFGSLASELYGTGEAPYLSIYADVASTGRPHYFETFFPPMNKHFAISSFSPSPGRFGTITSDITERKQAEQVLHEREQELSNIYSSVQDIIFQLGVETGGKYRFLSTNDAFNKVTGLDPRQIIGKLVNEVIPEPSLAMVLKNYRQAIKENRTIYWEETSNYPTGKLTGEVSITPILDADGKCTRLVGVVHDITERKQVEEELRKSEEQWRSLVLTIPDYVALLGSDGTYLFLNHYANGFSEKDTAGKKAYDFIMQESRQLFITQLEKCVKTKQTLRFEYQGYGSDKSVRLYEGFLAPIVEENRVVNILSLARDITERKTMEVALSKSEESFRNLFENSTVGLYRTTPDGKILLANPTLIHMLGYDSFEELAKRNLEKDGFEPGYKRQEFKRLVENGKFIQGLEITWKKKDGSDIVVRESAKAIRDTSGKVHYYEGTVEDVTQRKRAEEQLQRSSKELRARNEDLERFNKAAVGRELRMIELKKKINELCIKLGQPAPYPDEVEENL